MGSDTSPSSVVDFTILLIRCFWRITSSVLIYSCAFKSYYYCTRSSLGARTWLAAAFFSMAPNFFRLHGYSELLVRPAQPMGELRGLQLVRFCPLALEAALPSLPTLIESTRCLSGGVQNNTKIVVGFSVVPRTCQDCWVLLKLSLI